MTETALQDRASFGVSDIGLSQYRTPAPLPLPIAVRDYPYQPFPLTEFALDPFLLEVPGLRSKTFVKISAAPNSPEYQSLLDSLNLTDTNLSNPWKDTRPVGSTVPIWFYNRNGTVVHNEDIQAANARILAAYHVAGRDDLIEAAARGGRVSQGSVLQINEQLPYVQQAQEQKYLATKYYEARVDAQNKQLHSAWGTVDSILAVTTVVLSATPLAPVALVAYGAYTVARVAQVQVETGRVTGRQLLQEGVAITGAAVGLEALTAPAQVAATETLPIVESANFPAAVPLSGSTEQLAFA